jgi:hypothetical protein
MASTDRPGTKKDHPVLTPGPTTGGMGRVGQQTHEPALEEIPGVERPGQRGEKQPHPNPGMREGAPGFHEATNEERARPEGSLGPSTPASLQLDKDAPGRVNTGTGDQPSNTGGSRTGTPPQPAPRK